MAYAGRGYAWNFKEEYEKAISDYSKAIRLDPKYAMAYTNRGHAREAKAEYGQTLSDYGEAVRIRPSMRRGVPEPCWKPLAPMRNTVTGRKLSKTRQRGRN